MNRSTLRLFRATLVGAAVVCASTPLTALAQTKNKNPASKIFVSDVSGEAQIDTGESVEDLSRRSVYSAQGTVIETKRAEAGQSKAKTYSTMVYSNGTGAFFDSDTRVEIQKFSQEPFVPTRSDMDVEPSISQTRAFVSRGTVGLCNSKLVAGSMMKYATPLGSVNIRGQKVVIQAAENVTKISMLEGESTVQAGSMDMGGHTIHTGEQAIIRPATPGHPNTIEIVKIPSSEMSQLDDKVAMACMAKKTVYFEVRGRQQSNASQQGQVSPFDGDSSTSRSAGDPITTANGDIVAVPVLPSRLPVQFTISPASLITPSGNTVTPGNATPTPGQGGSPGG